LSGSNRLGQGRPEAPYDHHSVTTVSLALRVHSGWAALVAVAGDVRSPRVLLRQRVEMVDPDDMTGRQPYHAAEQLDVEKARAFLARSSERATARAGQGLKAAVETIRRAGQTLGTLGVLEAAGRLPQDLAAILASHALIHTAEGEHFRNALARAGEGLGLTVVRLRERDLEAQASAVLRIPFARLKKRLAALGRELGPPWTADQKLAALLAWLLLTQGAREISGNGS
jgi:hypothetical protein